MNYILFDGEQRNQLLPFTFTRPVADLRIGILTLREKWQYFLNRSLSIQTQPYLSKKYPLQLANKNIKINAAYLPTQNLVGLIKNLQENQALFDGPTPIAYFYTPNQSEEWTDFDIISYTFTDLIKIEHPWDLFRYNGLAIERDFELLTQNRTSAPLPDSVQVMGQEQIFVEQGARLSFCTLNATTGPIYIGKNAEIMEGVMVRGPLALGEESTLKMGAKIYGPTTIGPHSKVGGEVNNSVIFGYTNKAHDGFLGNSVLGEWCNLGADTNNSNLKNNYAEVRLWSYQQERFVPTGLQFCGLMMGDHSKCGINTMFNTGTVVGVSANIFGSGFPRNFIPDFSWGGSGGLTTYTTQKAFEVAAEVMKRREVTFTEEDQAILQHVFDITAPWRR